MSVGTQKEAIHWIHPRPRSAHQLRQGAESSALYEKGNDAAVESRVMYTFRGDP
jgi:hypothetical protein